MSDRAMTVKCTVDNCEYWDKGNYCGADGIMVDNNSTNLGNASMEIGSIGGSNDAKTSDQTCCQTFKPKSKA